MHDGPGADIFRFVPRSRPPGPTGPAIVLFDDDCGLCDRAVQFVAARDTRRQFRFVPLQSPEAEALLAPLGIDVAGANSVVLLADGVVHTQSEAALRILGGLPPPARWLGWFRLVPRALRDAAYRLVARNRRRWFGTKPMCQPRRGHDHKPSVP